MASNSQVILLSKSLRRRFESSISPEPMSGCWLWTGSLGKDGYGQIYNGVGGYHVTLRAARVAYEMYRGPIPAGLHIDHLCRNTYCVNPSHLEAVTSGVNTLRGNGPAANNARATHCPKGHPYDEANTVVTRRGWRRCIACNLVWSRESNRARRAANAVR